MIDFFVAIGGVFIIIILIVEVFVFNLIYSCVGKLNSGTPKKITVILLIFFVVFNMAQNLFAEVFSANFDFCVSAFL